MICGFFFSKREIQFRAHTQVRMASASAKNKGKVEVLLCKREVPWTELKDYSLELASWETTGFSERMMCSFFSASSFSRLFCGVDLVRQHVRQFLCKWPAALVPRVVLVPSRHLLWFGETTHKSSHYKASHAWPSPYLLHGFPRLPLARAPPQKFQSIRPNSLLR